jgi:hypothetical protein
MAEVKLGKRFRFPATHQFNDAVIEDVFIGVVALDVAVVRAPSHPFWLWRQVPFIWIAIADQARLDSCLARVRAIVWPKELRSIGDLPPSPGLTAAKSFRTRRHPKHRCSPVHDGADEVPLRPTEVARTGDQNDSLIDGISFKAKPAFLLAAKTGSDFSRPDDFSGVVVCPLNEVRPRPCAGSDCPPSDEPVEVQLQPLLKTNPLARSWHGKILVQRRLRHVVSARSESGREDILRSQKNDYRRLLSFQEIPGYSCEFAGDALVMVDKIGFFLKRHPCKPVIRGIAEDDDDLTFAFNSGCGVMFILQLGEI